MTGRSSGEFPVPRNVSTAADMAANNLRISVPSTELERVRSLLLEAGISDHEGGGGETCYTRPTWHMAEEAAAYSKEYLAIHDENERLLDALRAIDALPIDGAFMSDTLAIVEAALSARTEAPDGR